MDNDYPSPAVSALKRLIPVFTVIVIIFCAYVVVSAIITAETTGVLKISSVQKASISIGRKDTQAKVIGSSTDKANVRLKPGAYWVEAITSNGEVAVHSFSISKKETVKINLTPTTSPRLPSVSDVSFFGMSALTNVGLTSGQVDILKMDFFRFKTSAGAVNIDAGSVKTLPYILGNPSVVTFNVSIDSKTYPAKITYADMQNVQLQLYDQKNGQLLFNSSPPASNNNE